MQGVHHIVRPNYMAKGPAMGLWRGKKGSTVFYYNKNSNSSMKQAMRERVYEISNPKTRTQATQRMKVTPMQRVGSVLGEILKRSWQGIEYGGKGLQEFRKLALKMSTGYPYCDKGELRAIPGAYQISRGTLTPVDYEIQANGIVIQSLYEGLPQITIGEISTTLINNYGAQEGDQLTIVYCLKVGTTTSVLSAQYEWGYGSFIIDTTNTARPRTVIPAIDAQTYSPGGALEMISFKSNNTTKVLEAGALILSRPQDNSYMRSPATIALSADLDPWFTDLRRRSARLTYQATGVAAQSSDWEVEPTETSSPGLFTISGSSITEINGKKIWVRYSDDTGEVVGVYVTQESGGAGGTPPYVLDENGSQVFYTSGSNENAANPTDCGLGDVPTIEWSGIPTN